MQGKRFDGHHPRMHRLLRSRAIAYRIPTCLDLSEGYLLRKTIFAPTSRSYRLINWALHRATVKRLHCAETPLVPTRVSRCWDTQ